MIDFNSQLLTPGRLHIQRPPVGHRCRCGRTDFLVFPDTDGCLTWTCRCGDQRQITFRPNEIKEYEAFDIEFKRVPMDHGCECTRRDVIVLPRGRGELVWRCCGQVRDEDGHYSPCRRTWRIVFNEKTGEIYSQGS